MAAILRHELNTQFQVTVEVTDRLVLCADMYTVALGIALQCACYPNSHSSQQLEPEINLSLCVYMKSLCFVISLLECQEDWLVLRYQRSLTMPCCTEKMELP
jgi:hypothetical protein